MRPMPASNLGNGRDSVAQDPYAVDAVVFGVLFCESGQARYFRRSTGGNAWNDIQNRLIHAQVHPHCHGPAR